MTGKPFRKTRIIISDKLISARTEIKDTDSSAHFFKNAVSESMSSPRLDADLAIKSLGSSIGSKKKPTYDNTDNKTRTNSGGEPGMVVTPNGYRYQPKEKNGPGKKLVLFPSQKSRESNGKTSNFGWLDRKNTSSIKNYIQHQKEQPQIRIRKFKVNPKTDEIIPGSDIEMSPFRKDNNSENNISEKMLPGRTLGSSGTSLIGRAAGKFGIVRDALNKFRCPPGTPAANQFTDHMGSNCFGQSAGDLVDFAIDAFQAARKAFTEPNSRETLSKFFKEAAYDADNGRFGSFFARTMWRDADGNKIRNLRKWNSELREGEYKIFAGGMANAQLELEAQDNRIANLRDLLGIPSTPETRKNNDDLHEIFRILKERGMLNVTLGSPNPQEEGEGQRPTPEQVAQVVEARLRAVPGFSELPREQQKRVIANDIERFYETERALLEGFLDEYVKNPEHMGTIKNLIYEYKTSPPAEFLDEASYDAKVINGQAIGEIRIDIPFIMHSQETMLPQLADNERLRIDVVGAKTDSEAAKHLGDFLLTTAQHSKQHAATVEERGFARHIIKHEIAHSIQARAFFDEAKRQINENGFISIGDKKIESLDKLTGSDLLNLMTKSADSINLEQLSKALSRTENIMFMAGEYPRDYIDKGREITAIEATAELWALRNAGLIWGDDVDAALEWMDNIADGRIGEKRVRSDMETMRIVEDSYYLSPGESSAPWYVPEDPVATAAAKKRAENKALKGAIEKLDHDTIIDELAQLEFKKDEINLKINAAKAIGEDVSDLEKQLSELKNDEKIIRSVWKKKYGTGSEDTTALKLLIKKRREEHGAFTPDVLESKIRDKKIMAAKADAATIDSLDELVEMMAAYDLDIRLATSDKDKGLKREERKAYLSRYRALLDKSGDSRSWVEQKREMEEKIDRILRPTKTAPLKKPKTPTTDKQATDVGNKAREEALRTATPRQRIAVSEFSDSQTSSVAQLFDAEKRDLALAGMKERNQRLKKQGLKIDPTLRGEASPEEQVENILIPTMEIIDKSRIGTNLEVEAEIEVDVNDVTGEISFSEITHDSFISGRVLSKKNPFSVDSKTKPPVNGKQKRKVIIQTTEEDRGIFPHWSMDVDKDDKRPQKLVLPPGKLKVVEIRDDGTVVAQISEQKDTESVLDTLVAADIKGTRFRSVADRYIVERRENKIPREQKRPLKAQETQDRGILATRELKRRGGRFGQGLDDDDIDESSSKLSSGKIRTRSQVKSERIKTEKENIADVKAVLTGNEPTKFKSLSRDSLDPEVAELIIKNEPEQIIKLVEDAAVELHNSMDKRTRVRMRESELNNFVSSGTYNPRLQAETVLDLESNSSNRLRRRVKDFRDKEKQIAAAQGAKNEFKKLKEANMGSGELHKLDDVTLMNNFGLERSKQKSVISDNPVYRTNSAEQAIALLALGYEVEVPDRAERKMVKNAALQTEKELKTLAGTEADSLGLSGGEKDKYIKNFMETHDIDLCGLYEIGRNVFCNENIGVDREHMPQSGGPTKGANSPAMRALVSGHVGGDYKDASNPSLSKEDKERYLAIVKNLGNPNKFASVSDEDKKWAFNNTVWSKVEVATEPELIKFLKQALPGGDDSIIRKSKNPDDLFASQKQLRNTQIDKTAENIFDQYMAARDKWGKPGTEEFVKNRQNFLDSKEAWFQGAILTSRDGYVVDGHHRWAGIKMLNDHLPENEKIQVQVNELQTSIFEALTLAKVFQEHMEIKGKTVGKVVPYEDGETRPISKADFDKHIASLNSQVKEKIQEIKDKNIYPIKVKNLAANTETRSSGRQDLPLPQTRGLSSGRTSEILSQAKEKGIDIDRYEKDVMPTMSKDKKSGSTALIIGQSDKFPNGYKDRLEQAAKEGDDTKAKIIKQLIQDIEKMSPDELNLAVEDALKRLPPQFSQNISVQVSDPIQVIKSDRYLTVHDVDAMKKTGARGVSERFGFDPMFTVNARKIQELNYLGIPYDDDSESTRKLRPASGFVTSAISEKRRISMLKKKYGEDVEIQHPYAIGSAAQADNADMSQYGRSKVILRPDVAERSLVFQGDSITNAGSKSPAVKLSTIEKSPYRDSYFNPASILYADRTGDFDSVASPAANLLKNGKGEAVYQEAMILGSFGSQDIAAAVVSPIEIRTTMGKPSLVGINLTSDQNVTSIIEAAKKREEFTKRGIDLVIDSQFLPLDEVEPFNTQMTKTWVQEKIDSGDWNGVTVEELVPDEKTTPYEAFLRQYEKVHGVGTGETFALFDHPDNEPGNDEKNKINLTNMINEELKRLDAAKAKQPVKSQRSSELSSSTKVANAPLKMPTLIARDFNRHSNNQLITRKSGQIIDAAMRRAGFDKDIREKVNFAVLLISSYNKNNQHNTFSYFVKDLIKNTGPTIARISIQEVAKKERIPLEELNKILSTIDQQEFKNISSREDKNSKLAFNIAYKILNEIRSSVDIRKADYETKTAKNDLEMGQRFKFKKGSSADNYRLKYEEEIGIPADTPAALRPVTGYVVNKSHIEEKKKRVQKTGSGNYGADAIFEIQDKDVIGDGLTASGEIEVVLRPETANRVAYGRGNSFDTRHQPVLLDSTERDDIVNAVTISGGLNKDDENLDAMLHLLGSSKDKNYSHVGARRDSNGRMKPVGKIDPSDDREHEVFEANILGGFSKDEVEGIHYPFSKVVKLAENEDISDVINIEILKPRMQKLGFTSDEIQYVSVMSKQLPIVTPGIQKLKEYRTAKKIKKKYESMGIGYVKFAHPTGINIENPKTYNKTANTNDNPEQVIKQNIYSELDEVLRDIVKKMRKSKTRELVGDPE